MSSYKNYSEKELVDRISELESEIKKLKSRKKYGLVWEDKPEDVVLQCEKQFPVLKEIKDRKIVTDNTSRTNLLIEGDNYHALSVLNYTHKGKIDVIYIDPPYNTGNKSWKYNNDYVEKDDSFKHSKWISFIHKRISLAKNLLSDQGIILFAIDDYEIHTSRLIFDSIFGENNRLGTITVVHNPGGRSDDRFIATAHEYLLVYANNSQSAKINLLPFNQEQKDEFKFEDSISKFKTQSFIRTGSNSMRADRPNMFFPIFINEKTLEISTEYKNEYREILPIDPQGNERIWRWGKDTVDSKKETEFIVKFDIKKNKYSISCKKRLLDVSNEGKKPKTFWNEPKYNASSWGTILLQNILGGDKLFNYPKSLYAVKDAVHISSKNDSIILDFFAGSGTTGHAVMELNKEDGGNRQYILCTNNENNICEEVTYERLKRVIKGYKNKKGEKVEGLGGNLEYLKCEYIDKTRHTDNMKIRLMKACTEMLCLKENTFNLEKEVKDADILMYRIYSGIKIDDTGNSQKHHVGIYYDLDDSYLEDMRNDLKDYQDTHKTAYIFSLRSVSDFIDDYRKWKGINIEEVPQKILEIYESIYKRNSCTK
jgi:adenine-specific DNA-methyltransferase